MISDDGWLDWARRVPGPADKVYSTPNRGVGYVPHSAVGYYGGWSARLFSDERHPDGRYTSYAAASVHGWIAYDGAVTQHYPFTASCWASGSARANTSFIAFENEGGFDPHNEPLTTAQIDANVRIIRELAAWRGWPGFRRPAGAHDLDANLYEHRECVRFGSAATACPSGRIPWDRILAALTTTPPPDVPSMVYTVQRGDSLAAIAQRFGVTWAVIIEANRQLIEDPNILVAGWQLLIPGVAPPAPEPEVYVVQAGDTLYRISRMWGCSVADIVAANAIADPSLIRPGQTLRRP
jgi:LysM repeat protein